MLTIAIPTFDRPELLRKTVALVLPQLRPGVKLVIRDNASSLPAEEVLRSLLAEHLAVDVRIERNRFNLGGNPNILRCLELCESEWVWILGDDDLPATNAVETILSDIESAPADLVFINYRCQLYNRREERELRGLDDFVERVDSISSALFLSASILRAPAAQKHLRLAYTYAYSNMPHLIAVMYALREGGIARLSMKEIADWQRPPPQQRWSVLNAALAFPTMLDLPFSSEIRKRLAEKLEADVNPELFGLFRQLLALAHAERDPEMARWLWKQVRERRYGAQGWTRSRLTAHALTVLLAHPELSHRLVEIAARVLLGERAGDNQLQDRYARI